MVSKVYTIVNSLYNINSLHFYKMDTKNMSDIALRRLNISDAG